MSYPSRPVLEALPEFKGTAAVRQSVEQRQRLLAFSTEQYLAGRSLRQIAELTDRSQTAIRRALRQAGIQLRDRGAPSTSLTPPRDPDASESSLLGTGGQDRS